MQQEYVNIVACVCAAFGVHLVIPFHFKIKGKSNHSILRDFFTELYENLKSGAINEVVFFKTSTPAFSAVSHKMFDGVNLNPTNIFYIQIVPTGVRLDPTQNLTVNRIIKQ